jgi:hypothetical protein
MIVFQAEHNILMHPFHMLGVAGVFGGRKKPIGGRKKFNGRLVTVLLASDDLSSPSRFGTSFFRFLGSTQLILDLNFVSSFCSLCLPVIRFSEIT